ncbi:unnamed protein product [Fraxinus pennsylvanica]|uniref:DUF7579 domain-containing protein n=1 Tax=Fraxinus pennsylvanica TaxID=56036 RepID=A0AAD1YK10_9LAMI|nr:unnamed protein product [Fraxinus pennsylvanica]
MTGWLLKVRKLMYLIAMKPQINWELSPLKADTLMELDLSYQSEGKLFGAVSEVGEVKEHFKIRYMEGIILFPSTVTQIAVLTCAPDTPEVEKNCKLLIWINGTKNSQIEISCEDVVRICSGHNTDSSIGYIQHSKDVEDTS